MPSNRRKMSPPDLKIPLSNVQITLQTFSSKPSDRNGAALLQAEQDFFKALENHLALVRFLADTEVACVSPAARYYLTFSLIDYRKQPNQQPVQSLVKLLDSIGGESEK